MNNQRNQRSERSLIVAGAALGMLGVVAGTFAAHVLDKNLEPRMIETFTVAVRYQMYHALAVFCAAWMFSRQPGRLPLLAGWMFVVGVVLFSGSLYLLVATGMKWLGMVAPLGGTCFLVGWVLLAISAIVPAQGADKHTPA